VASFECNGTAACVIRETLAMKWLALATDYDSTLAHDGVVDDLTTAALDRFRESGRRLIMVTGRELPDLQKVCQVLDRFEWIVAENGALLYRPSDHFSQLLCAPASAELAQKLAEAKAQPLSVGRAIIATRDPYHTLTFELIRQLGLELQVIFNKGAVMVLPTGVNKATGLTCALKEMNLDAQNVVGVGDAENDHAFLSLCGLGVAVGNALPILRERADLVVEGKRGFGVTELIDRILAKDLSGVPARQFPPA
jgi:HAD superfamily hydrolase (TIGR01484 family)